MEYIRAQSCKGREYMPFFYCFRCVFLAALASRRSRGLDERYFVIYVLFVHLGLLDFSPYVISFIHCLINFLYYLIYAYT